LIAVVQNRPGLVLLIALFFSEGLFAKSAYFIGNSLTQSLEPEALSLMASSRNLVMSNGLHSKWGKDLDYIWNNPETYYRSANHYDGFANALLNYSWDFVSL